MKMDCSRYFYTERWRESTFFGEFCSQNSTTYIYDLNVSEISFIFVFKIGRTLLILDCMIVTYVLLVTHTHTPTRLELFCRRCGRRTTNTKLMTH